MGQLGRINRTRERHCYARGVDEAHVGEILDVFGVNARLRVPVVTVIVSEAAQLGADLPARIRKLAELKNARILTEGEFEVKEACAPEAALAGQNNPAKSTISD